ncbi:MAG: putative 3-deoxy-D-manno-octulosonate 8-phosphate phosphatase [Bacteriovoracaceae bacterium]|nr:putative 3-deoxy-D-manno-octulosonate 8-phosphate phosphatase [Bacteriovoracaceae bacterium]
MAPEWKALFIDVDGVMTDGKFYYSATGKAMKAFGPDDHDGLNLLRPYLDIQFVTGDQRGFEISKSRIVDDMNFPLHLVSTIKRMEWIRECASPTSVIYMGDGIFDHYVFREVGYSIAPANADPFLKSCAHFVTQRSGGDRAVAEAALHLLDKFFEPYNRAEALRTPVAVSGNWKT